MKTHRTLSDGDRAKLALLEDWERRAVWFDGGPELLSHEQMHRHHKTEPYIGCMFCRHAFVERKITPGMLERGRRAVNELDVLHLERAAEGKPHAEEEIVRAVLNAALITGDFVA